MHGKNSQGQILLEVTTMKYFDFSKALAAIPQDHCQQISFRDFMKEIIKTDTQGKIVDLGCGTGNFYDFISKTFPQLEYIGIDIEESPEAKQRTRSDFKFIAYDGVTLPFEDETIHIIFMNQVLEHVRAPHLLFPEIRRVLTKGGLLLGSVSQLEPYHSYSVMNYTFYGICSFLELFGLHTFKIRPQIDAQTLISRSVNKFIIGRGADFEDIFFSTESPISYSIEKFGRFKKLTTQQINLLKLRIAGQISFAAQNGQNIPAPHINHPPKIKEERMNKYHQVIAEHPELKGEQRYCNICGYRFAKFLPFGATHREAMCPVCNSLERHRHIYIYISALHHFLKGKKVLHFAPEPILKNFFIHSEAEYFDADINPQKATHHIDITNIPFENNKFDYIFCTHVLEHVPDDGKAMRELYRVLKPGGTAYLCVPLLKQFHEDLTITDPSEHTKLYGQSDHVRNYDFETFRQRLTKSGFNTDVISYPQSFPAGLADALLGDIFFLGRKL